MILQFCAFPSLAGRLIALFTEGSVGHVDAVLPGGSLLGAQNEAGLGGQPSGVQVRPMGYGGMHNIRRITLSVSPATDDAFLAFLMKQLGKPYDMTAIEAFVVERDWREPDSWICSELQAAALEAASVFANPLAAPANKITPQELFLLCSAFGPVTEVPNG